MGTEEELKAQMREVKWKAHRALDPFLYAAGFEKVALDTVLEAIGVSWGALSWIASHPEAATGLASGEMVATPAKLLTDWREARAPFLVPAGTSAAMPHSWTQLSQAEQALHNFASPPAPSGKAQGET